MQRKSERSRRKNPARSDSPEDVRGISPRERADDQEKRSARRLSGRTTVGSGNKDYDKGDVFISGSGLRGEATGYRVECKRTDKKSISIKKEWIDKIKRESQTMEHWAIEIEIQDTQAVLIPRGDFDFLVRALTKPLDSFIKEMEGV